MKLKDTNLVLNKKFAIFVKYGIQFGIGYF